MENFCSNSLEKSNALENIQKNEFKYDEIPNLTRKEIFETNTKNYVFDYKIIKIYMNYKNCKIKLIMKSICWNDLKK